LAAALAGAAGACRYDPVPQEIIDALGEETGTPGPTHRPGQPCLACHSTYEGAQPELVIGGTVFSIDANGARVGAPKVLVEIADSANGKRPKCSNEAGNFYITKEEWPDITFPLSVTLGGSAMDSLIGRDGSCASCHALPAAGALDPTGKSASSRGILTVNLGATDSACEIPQ
jgi:hypothetical protein